LTRKIYKILYLCFIVSVFLIIGFFSILTIVSAPTVSGRLTVLPSVGVRLYLLVDDQPCIGTISGHYCLGETLEISNKLKNFKNTDYTGNLSTKIINSSNQIVNQTDWIDLDLPSLETIYVNTSYTVRPQDEIGRYNISSNYTYDSNFTFGSCRFWIYKGIGTLKAQPDELLFFVPPGKSRISVFPLDLWLEYACDSTTAKMNKSSGVPEDWTTLNPEELLLLPGVYNSTVVNVTVPIDTELGEYYGWIYANADGQQVPINLTVVVTIIDFYVKTRIPGDIKQNGVCQGKDVYAEVNITKLSPVGEVDINMTYQLLHEGNVITETEEGLTLNDTLNSIIRVPILNVPSNVLTGNYTFLSHLQHKDVFYESADEFTVKSCITPPEDGDRGDGGGGGPPPTEEEKGLVLNLSTDILSILAGDKKSFVATVENTGEEAVEDVRISIKGIPLSWIEITPSLSTIPAKGTQGYLVSMNVPIDAETGVYELEVKATDDIDSNTEILTLIIGTNIKEIADLMIDEYQRLLDEATRSLLVEDCLDVTVIKTIHEEAKLGFDEGLKEYEKKNYAQAINWFEYAIPLEQKVVARVDISIEMELVSSNSSKIIIPPFYKPEQQFIQAQAYLEEKNYEEICDPIEVIRKYIMVGLIFWPGIVLIVVITVVFLYIFYRFKRGRQKGRILKEVRKRLIPSES